MDFFPLAGHALLAKPGCACKQWGLSKEKGSFFLPLWGMDLTVTSSPIKFILTISPWLFKIVRFTLIIIALEISIWIPSKPWCEQRHCNEIKLDERLVYMRLFPYWLPCLYWDSDQLIQQVNGVLVPCCCSKQYRLLASHKLNLESREALTGKAGNPGGLN